jgi:type I restriction enzyme S subunit
MIPNYQDCMKPFLQALQQSATPDMKLTIKFQKIVCPIMDEVIVLTNAIVKLNDIKNALLPRLISGKLSLEELDIQFPPSMQKDATV